MECCGVSSVELLYCVHLVSVFAMHSCLMVALIFEISPMFCQTQRSVDRLDNCVPVLSAHCWGGGVGGDIRNLPLSTS